MNLPSKKTWEIVGWVTLALGLILLFVAEGTSGLWFYSAGDNPTTPNLWTYRILWWVSWEAWWRPLLLLVVVSGYILARFAGRK